MAARFVLAIATYGERAVARERGERIEESRLVGVLHLGEIAALEGLPLRVRLCGLAELEQRFARRKRGQPDIIEIATCPVRLRHATRRPPHSADAQPFVLRARTAEPHDRNRHEAPPAEFYDSFRQGSRVMIATLLRRPC